jgi:hypothetical protein
MCLKRRPYHLERIGDDYFLTIDRKWAKIAKHFTFVSYFSKLDSKDMYFVKIDPRYDFEVIVWYFPLLLDMITE